MITIMGTSLQVNILHHHLASTSDRIDTATTTGDQFNDVKSDNSKSYHL